MNTQMIRRSESQNLAAAVKLANGLGAPAWFGYRENGQNCISDAPSVYDSTPCTALAGVETLGFWRGGTPPCPPGYEFKNGHCMPSGKQSQLKWQPHQVPQQYGVYGLGQEVGLGAVGPLGNIGNLQPGNYQITGTGVNYRSSPDTSPGTVRGTIPYGSIVTATGVVKPDAANAVSTDPGTYEGKGKVIYFAEVTTGVGNLGDGWVAVQYLAPQGQPLPPPIGGGGGTITPVVQPGQPGAPGSATASATAASSMTTPLLIGAGVLALGAIGLAVYASRKKKGGGAHHATHHHTLRHYRR